MVEESKVLESLLTGAVGSVGVLSLWVRQLLAEKQETRKQYQAELDRMAAALDRKDKELGEVTRESIGCITQVASLFDTFQDTLDRVEQAQHQGCVRTVSNQSPQQHQQ